MKLDLRKVWKTTSTTIGRCWRVMTSVIGKQQWLRKPLHWLRRIPAALTPIARGLRRMATATGPLLRPFRGTGRALARVPKLLWTGVRRLGRVPVVVTGALLAVVRLRPNATRVWSLLLGLLTVPFGAFLIMTPAKELMTTKEFDLRTLLPVTLALCGLLLLTAGLGMLFRAPSFRRSLWFALLFSLPLPAMYGHDTYTLLVKMNGDESTQRTLQPLFEGEIKRTLMFLGLSVGLCTLLWLRPLRRLKLQCTTPLLRGRAGVLLAPCYGGAFGLAAGYGLWFGLRELTEREALKFLRPVLNVVRAEYLAYGCGALGALWLLRRWWRGRTRVASRTAFTAHTPPTPTPQPTPPQRPAVAAPQKQIRQPQPVGWMSSRP
ncbi:MAG TPA: hypothetical protein VFD82_01825 [Planctomycetota bacterium]|nr:hypothetical protein [Planctomycetota bacterium]